MFKDLLSNLPQNPSMRADILFYSGRLRQESGIRLMGSGFLVLAFLVPFSAASYNPQKTYASDPNLNGLTPAANTKCSATSSLVAGSTTSFNVTTLVYDGQLTPVSYDYDLDANGSVDAVDVTTQTPHTHAFNNLPTGTHTVIVNVPLRS